MNNKGKLANVVFFLSLLCIFVICSVLVISYQINGYKNIVKSNITATNEHAPLAYLSNKVRSADQSNGISVENFEGVDMLVLDGLKARTYIYYYDGKLRELYASKDYNIQLSDGDEVFKINGLDINMENNRVEIKLKVKDNEESLSLKLRSQGGN